MTETFTAVSSNGGFEHDEHLPSALGALVADAFLGCVPMAFSAEETLTNQSIIEMRKLGPSDAVILEKINSSSAAFDTGVAALGDPVVSEAVMEAMRSASEALDVEAAELTGPATPSCVRNKPSNWIDRINSTDEPKLERIEPTDDDVDRAAASRRRAASS